MSFVDFGFWAAIPAVLVGYYLTPARWRPLALLLVSLLYFAVNSGWYVLLLIAAIGWTYAVGRRLAEAETDRLRQVWLATGLVPVVGALVLFKLTDFLPNLIVPLGISYYTFKLIAYLAEVYWDETQVAGSWLDFGAYVSFAPQMVAGPIQRPADFFEQLPALRKGADRQRIEDGFRLLLDGLMLKLVIGDRLGAYVTRIDADAGSYSHAVVLFGALIHLPYLYADFAGYTKIALGLGRLFGIEGPPNFNAPFSATNVQDYWRRWHMSLTGWLTDYVFMPLRMQTRRWGTAGLVFSIFVNMVLVGVWHKLSLTYLVFGLLQGLFLTVSALTLARRDAFFGRWEWLTGPRRVGGAIVTFLLMSASMIVWFAHSLDLAWLQVRLITGVQAAGRTGFDDLPDHIAIPEMALVISIYHGCGAPGFERVSRAVERFVPVWGIQGFKLLLLCALVPDQGGGFIYGKF